MTPLSLMIAALIVFYAGHNLASPVGEFRKLSLYPVELRPRSSIVILPALLSSAWLHPGRVELRRRRSRRRRTGIRSGDDLRNAQTSKYRGPVFPEQVAGGVQADSQT